MNFDVSYAIRQFPVILRYAGMTLKIAVVSMLFTLVFSLLITIIRYYRIRVWSRVVDAYVDLFRGTPLLVQLFFIYYGLPQIFPVFVNMSGYTAAVIGLTLNAASYMTEDMRGAISSVSEGQIDAGLSVGMTNMQVMRNSSMAFTLGVREIMAEASLLGTSSSHYMEAYLDAFIIYFILCKAIALVQRALERRLNRRRGGRRR